MISRRQFLSMTAAGAISTILPSCAWGSKSEDKAKRPNFVFILADDLGWGDLGCYGHSQIKTPNLDQMAKNGTLFAQFYVNACCSPTRAAIMTGHFPERHKIPLVIDTKEINRSRGVVDYLDPNVPTVTKLLKQAGYVTGHFGKWHLGGLPDCPEAPEPSSYGVDKYRIFCGNGPHWPTKDFDTYSSEWFVNESMKFIEENKDKPFYINLWLRDPHAPLDPTEEQLKPYKHLKPPGKLGEKYKGTMEIYYSVVTEMDKQIGRLLKRIDELGLSKDTIVVFSSDNGPEVIGIPGVSYSGVGSTGPFRGRKRSIYEGGVRTPFIIRWPGHIPAGKVNNQTMLAGVDWLPTICALAGAKVPDDLSPDGEDMTSAFLGKPQERTKPIMWERRVPVNGEIIEKSPMLAMRDGKWKLLMNPDRSRVELYDIPNDPTEVDNLASQYPDLVRKLSEHVLEWQKTLPKGPILPGTGSNAYPWPKEAK